MWETIKSFFGYSKEETENITKWDNGGIATKVLDIKESEEYNSLLRQYHQAINNSCSYREERNRHRDYNEQLAKECQKLRDLLGEAKSRETVLCNKIRILEENLEIKDGTIARFREKVINSQAKI